MDDAILSDRPTGARVLVVEDEEQLRRILVRNLVHRGYGVSEAGSVADAIALCVAEAPDVIVLDINLPDATGWDVLRTLDASGVARPRVVATSAVPPSRTRLSEFGPLTFLQKPFPIEALLRAVERSLASEKDRWTP
jgi:DNA-binding response OmpR family regulator